MPSVLNALQVGSGWFPERPGGLDRYFYDLLRALPAAGVQPRALVVGSSAVDAETAGSVHAYAAADESLLQRWRSVRRSARDLLDGPRPRPDVLVTHFAPYAFPLRGNIDLPTIVHFHGPWAAESRREGSGRLTSWTKRMIERDVYRRADQFIVLSAAFRDVLCSTYHVDPAKVNIIPGGVDLPKFDQAIRMSRQEARGQLGWPSDRLVLLSVRRLASRMGLERLIDAMAEVRQRVPDVLCMIAGRGRLESALAARIKSAGLQDHVRLLGFVPDADLPLAYRAADVSVVPSESLEGFGLSAAESLAAGTPVLVTPVGGLPEVVTGLDPALVLPADAGRLAGHLASVLLNTTSLPSQAECIQYAEQSFSWGGIAERVARVYAVTLKSGGMRAATSSHSYL